MFQMENRELKKYIGQRDIAEVVIPDSVMSIGTCAFRGCSSLTSITIPDSVTSIGDYAFWCCEKLVSITIPDNIMSIGSDTFRSCNNLTNIYVKIGNQKVKFFLYDGHLDDNTWQKMRILAKEKIKNSVGTVPVDSDNGNIEVEMLRKKYQQVIQERDDIKCKYDKLKDAYDSTNQELIIFKKKYAELENRIRASKKHTFCTFFELSEEDEEDLLREHVEL